MGAHVQPSHIDAVMLAPVTPDDDIAKIEVMTQQAPRWVSADPAVAHAVPIFRGGGDASDQDDSIDAIDEAASSECAGDDDNRIISGFFFVKRYSFFGGPPKDVRVSKSSSSCTFFCELCSFHIRLKQRMPAP